MKKLTMTKRYYTGAVGMAKVWFQTGEVPDNMMLLGEAITKATTMVENEEADAVFVVEVVKVIRRQKQPVIVESTR